MEKSHTDSKKKNWENEGQRRPESSKRSNKENHARLQKQTSKFIKVINHLDRQIKYNFVIAGISTRPARTNGLWCCGLLPAILVFYNCFYKVSPVYAVVAYLAVGQFCYSLLFIVFIYVSCQVLREKFPAGSIVPMFVSTIPLYFSNRLGLLASLTFSSLAIYPYYLLLQLTLVHCPHTFSVGEAMVVSQGIVLFANAGLADIYYYFIRPKEYIVDSELGFIKIYVLTVISIASLIVTAMYFLKDRRDMKTLSTVVGIGALLALIVVHSSRGILALPEFVFYIFGDVTRRRLFYFWLALVGIAVLMLIFRAGMECKASTEMRKVFHILAALVFLSGILYDPNFMMLAAGIIFGLIIFVEMLRVLEIEPVSGYLQTAFNVYSDEKDCGKFAMTPIYLYTGLACPLILVPWKKGMELELLSGVLSIGVGDTAASWFGHRYGNRKWAYGNRTQEGTAFNIVMQYLVVYSLQSMDMLHVPHMMFRTLVAAVISALVEARTSQVDNLVLPLVTILSFQATCYLA